jgi:RHS repeat-associated protein
MSGRLLSAITTLACLFGIARADVNAGGAYTTAIPIEVPGYGGLTPTVGLSYSSDGSNGHVGIGWSLDASSYITRSGPRGSAITGTADDVFLLDGMELVPCKDQPQVPPDQRAPSCLGNYGTHSTKIETNLRIKEAGSVWIVTGKDGTTRTYWPQSTGSVNGVYRWALHETVDIHGRRVDYDYRCEPGNADCFLETIRYETAEVRFYWASRPDQVQFATGKHLVRTDLRLKTIDVTVGGQRARAYALRYDGTHPQVPGSVLVEVKRWGSDATVDIAGNVSSGLSLPAETFATSPQSGQFFGSAPPSAPMFEFGPAIDNGGPKDMSNYREDSALAWDSDHDWQRWMPGDIDGDGKTDFIGTFLNHPSRGDDTFVIRTARLDRSGNYTHQTQITPWVHSFWGKNWYRVLPGDFNGDGKTDLVLLTNPKVSSTQTFVHLAISEGDGTFTTSGPLPLTGYAWDKRDRWFFGDVTGDARSDLVVVHRHGPDSTSNVEHAMLQVWPSEGSFSFVAPRETHTQMSYREMEDSMWNLTDIDGDGLLDIARVTVHEPDSVQSVQHAAIETARAKGDGTFQQLNHVDTGLPFSVITYAPTGDNRTSLANDVVQWGDFDGDGRGDLMIFALYTPRGTSELELELNTFLSRGSTNIARFTQVKQKTAHWPGGIAWVNQYTPVAAPDPWNLPGKPWMVNRWLATDVDGDGTTDLIHAGPTTAENWPTTVSYNTYLSAHDGTFRAPTLTETDWRYDCYAERSTCLEGFMFDLFSGDADGDGRSDLMYAGLSGGQSLTNFRVDLAERTHEAGSWLVADLDGDGRNETIYAAYTNPGVRIFSTLTSGGTETDVVTNLDDADMRHWLTGDVGGANGTPDGRTDLVYVYHDEINDKLVVHTLLSNGDGTFDERPATLNDFVAPDVRSWRLADIDGDGLVDLVRVTWSGGVTVQVMFANGSGSWEMPVLPPETYFTTLSNRALDWRTIDVNGDGMMDLVNIATDAPSGTQAIRVLRGKGNGRFVPVGPNTLVAKRPDVARWMVAEVNGDGRGDLVKVDWTSSTTLQVITLTGIGNGMFFEADVPVAHAIPEEFDLARTRYWLLGDINGDGRDDLLHPGWTADHQTATQYLHVLFNGRTGWSGERITLNNSLEILAHGKWIAADLTADRRADVFHPTLTSNGFVHRVSISTNASERAFERMVTQSNGLGGTTEVSYGSSAGIHASMPAGAARQIVSAVVMRVLPQPTVEHVDYTYDGARWSYAERKFLGYARRTQTSNYKRTTTRYLQTLGCAMAPYETTIGTTTNAVFAIDRVTYEDTSASTNSGNGPWQCREVAREHDECELTSQCRTTRATSEYDPFGNIKNVTEYGVWADENDDFVDDIPGDERSVERTHAYELPRYIVDRPTMETKYDGVSAQLISLKQYGYDGDGWSPLPFRTFGTGANLTSSIDDVTNPHHATRFEYDAWGNRTRTVDPMSVEVRTTWDPVFHARVEETCSAVGCAKSVLHDRFDVTSSITDQNGATTQHQYDALGRTSRSDFPDGGCIVYGYENLGTPGLQRVHTTSCVISENPDGPTDSLRITRYIDGQGRAWKITRPGGFQRLSSYAGNSTLITHESEWHAPGPYTAFNTTTYDLRDRPIEITHADGSRRRLEYAVGTVASIDELGRRTTRSYDGYGRLSNTRESVTENGSLVEHDTSIDYDAGDRVVRTTDAKGNETLQDWDSRGNLVFQYDPDRGDRTFTYDAANRLTSRTDALGQVTEFDYDGAGRQTEKRSIVNGSVVTTARWTWDRDANGWVQGHSIGRVVRVEDTTSNSTEDAYYDSMGRIQRHIKCVGSRCAETSTMFDRMGRPTAIRYPDPSGTYSEESEIVRYEYDPLTGWLARMPGYVSNFDHRPDGSVARIEYANGVVTENSYNKFRSWLDRIEIRNSSGLQFRIDYQHDITARIFSAYEAGATSFTAGYTYDELGRVTNVTGTRPQQLAYDAIGNIVSNSVHGVYKYDDPDHVHAVTSVGSKTYTYDDNGNLLSDGERTFAWTPDDLPATITRGDRTTTFLYDARGQRVSKQSPTTGVTLTLGALAEWNSQTGWTHNYFADGMLVARRDATLSFVHADVRGSTRLLTSASGSVLHRYDYDAFGKELTAGTKNDRRYIGQRADDETGLLYLNARYYDANIGRFVSADTIVPSLSNPQNLNRYAYSVNDPINLSDPAGHSAQPNTTTITAPWEPPVPTPLAGPPINADLMMSRLNGGWWGVLREAMSPTYAAPAAQYWADIYVRADTNGDTLTKIGAGLMGGLASTCSDEQSADLTNAVLSGGWGLAKNLSKLAEQKKPGASLDGKDNDVSSVDGEGESIDGEIVIDHTKHPETAKHIDDAQRAGHSRICTLCRSGADANRKESLRGIPTLKGYDRDEYPFAMCVEGGKDASVRYVVPSDNRGAGSSAGSQVRGYDNYSRFLVRTINKPSFSLW